MDEIQGLELDEAGEGFLLIPLRDLPPGSVVTVTIRVGPEPQPAQPDAPTETPRQYVGRRING